MINCRLKRIVQIRGSRFILFTLFRTKNNPKGPDIKWLQHLNFDLVGSRLSLSLPYRIKGGNVIDLLFLIRRI